MKKHINFWPPVFMLLLIYAISMPASAHEVRPAYLEIKEDSSHHISMLWKQPANGEMAINLRPHITAGWMDSNPSSVFTDPSYFIKRWDNVVEGKNDLDGQVIWIEGLEQTITDVLVNISFANRTHLQQILKPSLPRLTISARKTNDIPAWGYIQIGIGHILTGFDHLLFVLGLLLLVRKRSVLIKTITAFTIAHSITLTCTTLGWIKADASTVEALIALSIIFLAVELVHRYQGREGITIKFPWIIAFTFGLLHGFGFAGALADVGLPQNDVPLALLFFNVGVEIGQLIFVTAALLLQATFYRLIFKTTTTLPGWARLIAPYGIGTLSAFWFFERLFYIF